MSKLSQKQLDIRLAILHTECEIARAEKVKRSEEIWRTSPSQFSSMAEAREQKGKLLAESHDKYIHELYAIRAQILKLESEV